MATRLIKSRCVVKPDARAFNIFSALARGLPICTFEKERPGVRVAVVGTAPSVRDYADELKNFDGEIWAVNGAYDFFCKELRRVPEAFVGIDPQVELGMHLKHPKRKTIFYLASCCHPDLFDMLGGYDVRIWHSNSDVAVGALPSGQVMVPGGGTALTRAPFLAYVQGIRDVTIYGADCSFREGESHLDPSNQWREPENDRPIIAVVNGKEFLTRPTWMQQASSLGVIETVFPAGYEGRGEAKIAFRCGGMLPEFLASTRPLEDIIDVSEPIEGIDYHDPQPDEPTINV